MRNKLKTFLKVSALLALAVSAAVSCRTRSTVHPVFAEGEAYTSSLTSADTLSLTSLADSCMSLLVDGEYAKALAGVGYAEDGVLQSLTPEMVSSTASSFRSLGVISFERVGLDLVSTQENTVRYRLRLAAQAQTAGSVKPSIPAASPTGSLAGQQTGASPADGSPSSAASAGASSLSAPTTVFAFNAYRIDGRWYLSLKQ